MKFDPRLITLERIAQTEFSRLVVLTDLQEHKLRITMQDGSYLDAWLSEGRAGVYAFHWERRHLDGTFFRHDNIPHARWRHLATWPKHFHNGSPENVQESDMPDVIEEGMRYMLRFIQEKMK